MKIALLQMTSGIDRAANAVTLTKAVREAAAGGATMLFTPEMSGLLDRDRGRAADGLVRPSKRRSHRKFAYGDSARIVEVGDAQAPPCVSTARPMAGRGPDRVDRRLLRG